jgi:hypothetical protein
MVYISGGSTIRTGGFRRVGSEAAQAHSAEIQPVFATVAPDGGTEPSPHSFALLLESVKK